MQNAASLGTPRPSALSVQVDQIPEALTSCDQWVVWRLVENAASGWTKPPFNPRTGLHASTTARATWVSFACAVEAYFQGKWDGLGFVISPDDPLVGIDLDHCRNPTTGEIDRTALVIVTDFASYAEVSPSGTGLRIWVVGSLAGLIPSGRHGRKRGPIEVYDGHRFLTVTGHSLLSGTTIENRQVALEAFVQRVFATPEQPATRIQSSPGAHESPGLDDEMVIARALKAANGRKLDALWNGETGSYASESEADLALLGVLAFWSQDPRQLDRLFRLSGRMRSKWERRDYRERTIAKALERRVTFGAHEYKTRRRRILPVTPRSGPAIELTAKVRRYDQ